MHILTGPAGSGKTAIALRAAQILEEAGHRVFWITARNRFSFVEGLAALAVELGGDEATILRYREKDDRAALWDLLDQLPAQSASRSVLVIDNADDPYDSSAVLREALRITSGSWFVVITSRLESTEPVTAGVRLLRVGPLSKISCSQLIRDSVDDVDYNGANEASGFASRTADLLGRLPLALHVAGAQQGSSFVRHTLAGYGDQLDLLTGAGPIADGSVGQVALAVQLGLKAIRDEDRQAVAFILSLLASMAPAQPFPIDTLEVVIGTAVEKDGVAEDEVEPLLRRGHRTLRETGLIEFGVEDGIHVLWIHPLVADAVQVLERRSMLGATVPAGFAAEALDRASGDLTTRGIDKAILSLWRLVIPHVQHLLTDSAPDEERHAEDAMIRAASRSVRHLLQRGLYPTALALAERAVQLTSGAAPNDPNRLTAALHHAMVCQALRLYDDAFMEISEVVERYEGLDLPAERLKAEHLLASLHHDLGELAEAEEQLTKVLRERTDLLGADHLDTLATRNRLGMVVHAAGRASAALKHFDAVYQGRLGRLRDSNHPDVIAVRQSQAYATQAIGGPGSLERAKEEFEAIHKLRQHVLGDHHPNTLVTQQNLAWIEQAQGRYVAAENRFRKVLDVQLRRLEPDHPHTVGTAANLAWDLIQLKKFSKAHQLFHQILYFRSTQLRHNHPDTQTTRGNIAWLTYEEGESEEAAFRLNRLVADRERTLGRLHPRTLTTRHNLALSLRSQRDYPEAVRVFRELEEQQRTVIGSDHPSTLSTRFNLAVTLRLQADDQSLEEADQLLSQILATQLTVYSSRHPDTVRTREELIATLRQRGNPIDLDRASDEQTPSRVAAVLSRHHSEQEFDEAPAQTDSDDHLIAAFVRRGTGSFIDPDIEGLRARLSTARDR